MIQYNKIEIQLKEKNNNNLNNVNKTLVIN